MTRNGRLALIGVIIALVCAAGVFFACFGSYGHLHIRVVDAYTLTPLRGARVIIPDIDKVIFSDDTGSCVFTGIPIRTNSLHRRLLAQSWGECTVISICEGYRPTVNLHTRVEKGRMRSGPAIYMFPEELDDIEVAVTAESPDEEWISELIEEYS